MQSNNTQRTLEPIPIYFKKAWSTNTKTYLVYPDWTLNQFRDALKPLIAIDFNLNLDNESFELVHMGQLEGENGNTFPQSNEIKLKDLWSSQLNIGFYIRII